MNVFIVGEFSGRVRDEFLKRGHNAWSCDLLPSESEYEGGHHFQGDYRKFINKEKWDMMIAFPPCTHLCVSGARWFKDKVEEQKEAINFFMELVNAPFEKICIENPIGIMSTKYRKPDQIIQPWQFGHGETKATCLWLKNLHLLIPTKIVDGREAKVHLCPPGPDRWKIRSVTYLGIAKAMAEQWG